MPKMLLEEIKSVEEIAKGIFKFSVFSDYVSKNAKPGQFVNIKCNDDSYVPLLRRPISIMNVDREKGTFDFVIQVKGIGTENISKMNARDKIDIMACLGNSFEISESYKNIAVVGGGIGIFPLLFLINDFNELNKNIKIDTFLGFRNKDLVVLENEFKSASGNLFIATDDGSYGHKGLVTELLIKEIGESDYDIIYTCGPLPMIRKVALIAANNNIKCQVSLEQRMGCGIGACLVCVCNIKSNDKAHEYKHVCKDGPVFWADKIVFED
ncbi:MAG: dihydroorotate dehydrogenase electron transfer subunit [Clostridia bacterium]